jgi:hypothetical protein
LERKWIYRVFAGVFVLSLILLPKSTPQQAARAQTLTPVAYFPLIYKAEPVRFDDFTDEDPVWEQYYVKNDPKDGGFFHRDGQLAANVWDNSGWVVASPGWRPLGDFRVEVDAHFVTANYNNYVNTLGLVFGGEIVQDVVGNWTVAEFYEFVLAYKSAQHQWAVRRRDADWSVRDLQPFGGVPSFVGSWGYWNHFVVLRIQDKIHVFCNGRRMPSQPPEGFTDGTYGTNRLVGVSIGSWELDRGEMEFDNFLLTPLSQPY